jgi:hypothetical protein
MHGIVTLSERKAAEAARRQQAAVVPLLTDYARAHGGRICCSAPLRGGR